MSNVLEEKLFGPILQNLSTANVGIGILSAEAGFEDLAESAIEAGKKCFEKGLTMTDGKVALSAENTIIFNKIIEKLAEDETTAKVITQYEDILKNMDVSAKDAIINIIKTEALATAAQNAKKDINITPTENSDKKENNKKLLKKDNDSENFTEEELVVDTLNEEFGNK